MSNEIGVTQVSSKRAKTADNSVWSPIKSTGEDRSDLQPWIKSLAGVWNRELPDMDKVSAFLDQVPATPEGAGGDPFVEAAQFCLARASKADESLALFASLYLLKLRGYEPGTSLAGHWRINRLLNAGSRAVDFMIDDERLRGLAMETLGFRLLKSSIGRARVDVSSLITEVSGAVTWDKEEEGVLRRRLVAPSKQDDSWSEILVEWLLSELLSRGLTSLTAGAVIEESLQGRRYTVSDEVASRMAELPADEARFLGGALFLPAQLGGFPRSLEDRILDAFAMAREISEDFVPDETKIRSYAEHLRWVDARRGLPEIFMADLLFDDGQAVFKGRWGLLVHPLRRLQDGKEGYFTIEAGVYFREEDRSFRQWSSTQLEKVSRGLGELAAEEEDRSFTEFAGILDEVVDGINKIPGAMWESSKGAAALIQEPSPLWDDLDEGLQELHERVAAGDVKSLAQAFENWSILIEGQ